MKRHKVLQPLSREHHEGLILAQGIKKDTPPAKNLPPDPSQQKEYVLRFFKQSIVPHFKKEEAYLFPLVQGQDEKIDQLIIELKAEHTNLRNQVNALKAANDLKKQLHVFGNLLEKHIRKEERIFFQRIQNVIPEEMLEQLAPYL